MAGRIAIGLERRRELIATSDVGPRIMRYSFVGGKNVLVEFKGRLGKSGEKEWMMRGGHRLWAAPKSIPDTYALDNGPVKATVHGDVISFVQPVEPETGLQKEITIKLAPSGTDVEVIHKITNTLAKPGVSLRGRLPRWRREGWRSRAFLRVELTMNS